MKLKVNRIASVSPAQDTWTMAAPMGLQQYASKLIFYGIHSTTRESKCTHVAVTYSSILAKSL